MLFVVHFRHRLHMVEDPLGIPAAFYFLLSRQRSSINPPTDKVVKELRGTLYVVVSTLWLGGKCCTVVTGLNVVGKHTGVRGFWGQS